jgi:hypothetical protein
LLAVLTYADKVRRRYLLLSTIGGLALFPEMLSEPHDLGSFEIAVRTVSGEPGWGHGERKVYPFNMNEGKNQTQEESVRDPEKLEADLKRLVEVLTSLGMHCADRARESDDVVRHHAVGVAVKLARHTVSALTLVRERSALVPQGPGFLDGPSVQTLTRAAWESFLLFHHLFVDVEDDDERAMRHRRWLIAGARFRQSYEAPDPEQEQQKRDELEKIHVWEDEIRANHAFRRLCPDCQEHFLKGRRWHAGWGDLGKRAGISRRYAHDYYSYLCDFAHSGPLSVIGQIGDQDTERTRLLRVIVAGVLAIAVANVIEALGVLFPSCRELTGSLDTGLVEHWVRIGRGHKPQAGGHWEGGGTPTGSAGRGDGSGPQS